MPFIDFAALKAAVTLDQVAELVGLTLKQEGSQFRTACPACKQGGDRAIVLTPAKGLFYCFSAKKGGDCIGLAAHIMSVGNNDAANFLVDQLGTDTVIPDKGTGTVSKDRAKRPEKATAPQKPEGRKQPAPAPFDPEKFAANLAYSDEVAALGISEEDATRLGIGWHPKRKKVYFPVRNPDASLSGFIGCDASEKLILPPQWLAGAANVVRLKRA